MERLPEELLVHIFSYLGFKDLTNLKSGCTRFQHVIYANSKRMKKHKDISMTISAQLDSNGKRTLEIRCGDPEEHNIVFNEKEITTGDPFYFEWMNPNEKTWGKSPFKKKYEKHLIFLDLFSRTISDGRPFGPEHPLPSTSMDSDFQKTLVFLFKGYNLDSICLGERDRDFTSDELNIILTVFKATGTTVSSMRRMTEALNDQYLEIIRELRCNQLSFCSSYDEEMNREICEYSVDKRILLVPCEHLSFYEPIVFTASTMILLLKQWRDGIRQISRYVYHHKHEGFDWFPLVRNDFRITKYLEEVIWSMNADVEVKTFTLGREIDDKELKFNYFGTYLEINCYPKFVPKPKKVKIKEPEPVTWDDEEEDLGFGLLFA